ncbi:MAG TPA: hypothetical protein VNW73_05785 [Ktedonobacteraceae bacterium]|jgi:uncharacterized membrane protein|nr:hypothetical protein [Ktedonobacteraceae bacterium]
MMNRDRLTRGRSYTDTQTRLGLPERVESALVYPLSLLLGLFVPVIGWILAWLLGLGVFYFERNRNVRRHGLQSAFVFGTLSVILAVLGVLKLFLGGIFVIGGMIAFGLGLLTFVVFWVMIILAVFLTVMAFMRPDYRLPYISRLIDRMI